MASQKLLVLNVTVIKNYGYAACNRTLGDAYGRSLRKNELCIPVISRKIIVENVCAGDLSGSPLVCDGGVLVGLLANRETCAPNAVHTFADISRAVQWLRRRESTRAIDHFVLVNNTSITLNSTGVNDTIYENYNETNYDDPYTVQLNQYIDNYYTEQLEDYKTSLPKEPSEIAPVVSSKGNLTAESRLPAASGFSFTLTHFTLVLSVSAALSLLVIALVISYALSKWCSKWQSSGGVVLSRTSQ